MLLKKYAHKNIWVMHYHLQWYYAKYDTFEWEKCFYLKQQLKLILEKYTSPKIRKYVKFLNFFLLYKTSKNRQCIINFQYVKFVAHLSFLSIQDFLAQLISIDFVLFCLFKICRRDFLQIQKLQCPLFWSLYWRHKDDSKL